MTPTYLLVGFLEQNYYRRIAARLDASGANLAFVSHLSAGPELASKHPAVDSKYLHRTSSLSAAFPEIDPQPLSGDCLVSFEGHRILAARSMDRVFLRPLSIQQAETYLLELLSYWLGYLNFLGNSGIQISGAFFSSIPHFPWDIVLDFALSEMAVPRRYVRETPFDRVTYIGTNLSRGRVETVVLSDADHLWQARASDVMALSRDSHELSRSRANNVVATPTFRALLRRTASAIARVLCAPREASRRRHFSSSYFRLGLFRYLYYMLKIFRTQRQLLLWLEKHSVAEVEGEGFVLFALHMQPERTTDPEAGDFRHQYLAIRMLSEATPPGTRIVVKEHPAQFGSQNDLRKLHFRSLECYERIARIPGVEFAPIDAESRELIGRSSLVASCRGSILWESLIAGRPCVSFAKTWHSECDASPFCDSTERLAVEAAHLMQLGEGDVGEMTQQFLGECSTAFVRASFGDAQWRLVGKPDDDVENLAFALLASLDQ